MESECPSCNRSITREELVTRQVSGDGIDVDITFSMVSCPDCGEQFSIGPLAADDGVRDANDDQDRTTDQPNKPADNGVLEFAHFRLLRILGKGGFGTVWLADDTQLERKVALKLPAKKRPDMKSLIREAKTAAKLQHPHIVSIHHVGELAGQVYIVCEYIEGMDLRSLMSKGLLPQERVLELLRDIASGLHHAHENHIVHRDMKPGNVLVDGSGKALVTDFGLAKRVDVEESISSRGRIVGTVMYMAPEQASNEADQVDRRADLYALGLMMYEMLTGERPFRGNVQAILHAKTHDEPTPLRRLRPSIPLDLETICLKCMERTPARRYHSAAEFIDELDRFSNGLPITARPISNWEYAWRWCLRNQRVSILAASLLLSLVIGLVATTTLWFEAMRQTENARRSLYASKMNLASGYLHSGDIASTQTALQPFSEPELQFLRGFEWYYLNQQLRRFRSTMQHGKVIHDVALSRGADWLASVADTRELQIFDADSGKLLKSLPARTGRWQSVAISPRDNLLAAGAKDGSIYLWDDVHDADRPPRIIRHGQGVTTLMFSRDGLRLFSAGSRGAVRVWDPRDESLLSEIPTGKEGQSDLAASADGSILAVLGDGILRTWEVDTRSKISTIEDGRLVRSIALTHDGTQIVAGTYNSSLLIYDVSSGNVLFEENTSYDWISDIEMLGNSSIVSLCSSRGKTVFFDVEDRTELNVLSSHHGAGGTSAVSSNGKAIAVGSQTGVLSVLDIPDFMQSHVLQYESPVREVRLLQKDVAIASYQDGSVHRLDFSKQTKTPLCTPQPGGPVAIAVSSRRGQVVMQRTRPEIVLLDATGKELDVQPTGSTSERVEIRFSNRGSDVAVAYKSGVINLYSIDDRSTAKLVARASVEMPTERRTANVRAMCFRSDDAQLAVGWDDGTVCLLNLSNQQWKNPAFAYDDSPVSLTYFEDDLIVGLRNGVMERIEIETGVSRWRTQAHVGHLNQICFIPGNSEDEAEGLASVGRDRGFAIWDGKTGELTLRLFEHERQVFSVDAFHDGTQLVTGGLEGSVRIWNAERN